MPPASLCSLLPPDLFHRPCERVLDLSLLESCDIVIRGRNILHTISSLFRIEVGTEDVPAAILALQP